MSCEFQLTATLEGINKFFDDVKSNYTKNESESSKKSFHNSKIAVSPTGEIAVFANSTWLLICGSKWDSSILDGAKIKYTPNWHGHVSCKPGEEITSVFCLPFISQCQSNIGCADWTCIILGFSSGCIRFYTESMHLLACSILHEEKVNDIKYFSQLSHMQQGKHQKQENGDIYVLYKTVICILSKTQLIQTLQNKRNYLAKGVKVAESETESYLSLDFKKYSFVEQEEVADACYLGHTLVSTFNTFDHLVTASLVGGFNSNFRGSPPQTSLIISTGRRPFVGFHYALEGLNSPVLMDVALAVASKIKNSVTATLPDWFSFGGKKSAHSEKPKEVSQEYAEELSCRFGLCDLWRQGLSVVVSPNGTFSAVTDSLGRVTLIDNTTGIAHQLWKGFRDAQCGFLQIQEDVRKLRRSKSNVSKLLMRQALFIVIYAPKRGLIEILTTQHGRHVTSFKVPKNGRLLYSPYAQTASNISAGGFSLGQNQVVFISEEGFREFSVPFHWALAEDNKISKDLHILKKMRTLLKMESNATNPKFIEEIEKCAKDFKTDEIRLQAIEYMIAYRNVTLEAFKCVLEIFLESLQSKDRVDPAPKKVLAFAEVTLSLLRLYEFLLNLNDLPPNSVSVEENMKQQSCFLSEGMRLPQNELDVTLKFIQQILEIERIKQRTTKVGFEEKRSSKLVKYLSCFDFESFLNSFEKNEKQEEKKGLPLQLNFRSSGKENSLCCLGELLYKGLFNSFSSFGQWKKLIKNCCLNPQDLAVSLISFWCNKTITDGIIPEVLVLVDVLKFICSLSDSVAVEYNTESPWWKQLRSFIAGNPNTIRGLFAALCCRSVTIFVEQERELSLKHTSEKSHSTKGNEAFSAGDASTFNNDWETISKDSCQWDILIVQLQDVALLNAVLNLTFKTESSVPMVPFDFERQCLTSIQLNGTGRVSELVAKWLVQFGFEPSALIDTGDVEFQVSGDGKAVEKERSELISAIDKANEIRDCNKSSNPALEYLALLKSRFPYSLTSSSLLSNMCWEYLAYWFKNNSDLCYLKTAVQYLDSIPSRPVKYGISYLSWNTYLVQKFETLAKMINRIGKVPRNKLCLQEIGLSMNQVPAFLEINSKVLLVMLQIEFDDKPDLRSNREAIWQSSSTPPTSNLVSIALSQPLINNDLISFQLQLCYSLYLMTGLDVKHSKVFSSLFDTVELPNSTQNRALQSGSHYQNLKLKNSRSEFLSKCLTAAVQTIELVEYIPPISSDEDSSAEPTSKLNVDLYKKWLQLCYQLAGMWAVPLDEIRKHQICELYSNGFDRLAEEVIPSVSDTDVLASKLLVLGGKRLKYLIQDSDEQFLKQFTKLSANLGEWLDTLDLENFTYHGAIEDIEVLMRYAAQWLPADSSEEKLAVAIIESLAFLKAKNT